MSTEDWMLFVACQQIWKKPSTRPQTFIDIYQDVTETQKTLSGGSNPICRVWILTRISQHLLELDLPYKVFTSTLKPERWLKVYTSKFLPCKLMSWEFVA